MGKILEYIEKSGDGKYLCYKTKKFLIDNNENYTIAYNNDDKTPSMSRKSNFAETYQSRLVKDDSMEYNPRFSNIGLDATQWNNLYANIRTEKKRR